MWVMACAVAFLAAVQAAPLQSTVAEACIWLSEHAMAMNVAIAAGAVVCAVFLSRHNATTPSKESRQGAQNVGILAAEVYFPSTFVRQSALETANNVAPGKYTKGLGQEAMAFTGDQEDINSVALTVLKRLLEKYGLLPRDIGRLEVGTETLVDKSKSTKTVLMQLFEASGHTDVEGASVINACYGGTAALINAVNFVEAPSWNGKYAVVIAADIACYADGPARPTGGAGAVAVLVGPDAPLAIDLEGRATHAANVWDFYKPRHDVEYPEVDGKLSQTCYLRAVDDCYARFSRYWRAAVAPLSPGRVADFFVFHAPYNKLVQKAWSRIQLCDAVTGGPGEVPAAAAPAVHGVLVRLGLDGAAAHLTSAVLGATAWAETYADRDLDYALRTAGAAAYDAKVAPAGRLSQMIGNTYTASVFCGLVSLIDAEGAGLEDKRVVLFSYGSGAIATMYGLRGRATARGTFSLARMQATLDLAARLASREELPPLELGLALDARHRFHLQADLREEVRPVCPADRLFPGTYYLDVVSPTGVRRYERRPLDAVRATGGTLVPAEMADELSQGVPAGVAEGVARAVAKGDSRGAPRGTAVTAAEASGYVTATATATASPGANALPARPENVGILATEVYFPSTCVQQADLEEANGVGAGKYTKGLGQLLMAFTGDREDINSVALTALHNLLEKYDLDPTDIGRLEVGTETLVDKSKSTKTVLMQLFEASGHTDVEGVTTVNACYGGTAALINAVNYVEASSWNGKYAVVLAADIAVYEAGPARPTGGAGAVAVLIGPDAPLVVDLRGRATHASNVWDFYKPHPDVEYPEVDGKLSQTCYLHALDDCYTRFAAHARSAGSSVAPSATADHFIFHAPYNKLVQKAWSRILLCDALVDGCDGLAADAAAVVAPALEMARDGAAAPAAPAEANAAIKAASWRATYADRDLDYALRSAGAAAYEAKVAPAGHLSQMIGNTYTASVFCGIVSLLDRLGDALEDRHTVVFSYGSGALATMYGLRGRRCTGAHASRFSLGKMQAALQLDARLEAREILSPEELEFALDARHALHERTHKHGAEALAAGTLFEPVYPVDRLFPGSYYLQTIHANGVRDYERLPATATRKTGGALVPAAMREKKRLAENGARALAASPDSEDAEDVGLFLDEAEAEAAAAEKDAAAALNGLAAEFGAPDAEALQHRALAQMVRTMSTGSIGLMQRKQLVVTGVSAGLPGRSRRVFAPDNLERLLRGENCIEPLTTETVAACLDKNVVQLKKSSDGTAVKMPVRTRDDAIKLAAQLGTIDLTEYGVTASIAMTMDTAAQVAVAAGLEALKNAQLVEGVRGEIATWKLPENQRDNTGVVYASSFPALDAAIGEVMRLLGTRSVTEASAAALVLEMRRRMMQRKAQDPSGDFDADQGLDEEDEELLQRLEACLDPDSPKDGAPPFVFDRKFLFRVLVLGNAQLAQIVGARGPNTQTNAACAGTTQAIAMAYDMLCAGRAERVIVISGDNASSNTLMPWLGNGFRALGAASTAEHVEDAALPFDKRRSGMLLGAGAIGMVIETEKGARERWAADAALRNQLAGSLTSLVRCRLLGTQYSNSAYHGAALDRHHIASELVRFLNDVEDSYRITREELCARGVYLSHETCTHASPSASCASNEVYALREAFGDHLANLVIINTKGFTGHPMGVSFEDAVAVECLKSGTVPPMSNWKVQDEHLGELNLSRGGRLDTPPRYALRFAAGFGSQVAFALYGSFLG